MNQIQMRNSHGEMKTTRRFFIKAGDWLTREWRLVFFIYCAAFIVALHLSAYDCKIRKIETNLYKHCAIDLKVTPEYRYGFASSLDGTVLVKTLNSKSSSPHKQLMDKKLHDIMLKELRLIPLKTAMELIFYILLLVYAFFGSRWFKAKLHIAKIGILDQCCFSAISLVILWAMVLLPYGLFDYGDPLYEDTRRTIGAFHGDLPFLTYTGNALTITYYYLLYNLVTFPMKVGKLIDYVLQYLPFIKKIMINDLLIFNCLFYGLVGFFFTYAKITLSKRKILCKWLLLALFVPIYLFMVLSWKEPFVRDSVKSFMNEVDLCKRPLVLLNCNDSPKNTNRSQSPP